MKTVIFDLQIDDASTIVSDSFPQQGDVIECCDELDSPGPKGRFPTRNVRIISRAGRFDPLLVVTKHFDELNRPCAARNAAYSETHTSGYQRYLGVYTSDPPSVNGDPPLYQGTVVHGVAPDPSHPSTRSEVCTS